MRGALQDGDGTAKEQEGDAKGGNDRGQCPIRSVGRQEKRQPHSKHIPEYGGEPSNTERRHIMAKPKAPNDQCNRKRQHRTADKGADKRPVEDLVDRRSRHSEEKGGRQREIKDEAVEGGC